MAFRPHDDGDDRVPERTYNQRCAEFGRRRDEYTRRSNRNGNVSLALIGLAVASAGLWLGRANGWWLALAGLFALGFAISFIRHGRVNQTLRRYSELYAINAEGLARLRRDWDALPLRQPLGDRRRTADDGRRTTNDVQRETGIQPRTDGHTNDRLTSARPVETAYSDAPALPASVAADLDLLGHASLQHLLSTPVTPVGLAALRDWLLSPAPPAVARERQGGVAELAPLNDFRDEIALRGRILGEPGARAAEHSYEQFLDWAESPPWLAGRAWLLWLARALPLLALALALAQLGGMTALPIWLAPIALGVVLTATIGRQVDAVIDQVAERQGAFAIYAEIFRLVAARSFTVPALRHIQETLAAGHLRADMQMRRLKRVMALADLRGWMFFYPIQIATLWNVHVLWLLERWQRDAGPSARDWLAALGELEALGALATLAHDNPTWAFPALLDAPKRPDDPGKQAGAPALDGAPTSPLDSELEARNLGHPLLPPRACVGNDVAIGPGGRFLLVTGSNMSGKSTLLRSIGVNVALAQAGGPVCADAMRLPPIALSTSMRAQDSLEQGVSYFMAELRRLKQVVDTVEQARAGGAHVPLFLLDEILHGTNTAERQIAARRVILHLLALGATGAVSTHDLTLAQAPELAERATFVHFTERFTRGAGGPSMTFDYRLRPGVATSTNALRLMEMIGLPIQDS